MSTIKHKTYQMSVFPPISSLRLLSNVIIIPAGRSSLWTQSIKTQSSPHSPAPNGGSPPHSDLQTRAGGLGTSHTCPLGPGTRVCWPRAPLPRVQGPQWPPKHFMCPSLLHTAAAGPGTHGQSSQYKHQHIGARKASIKNN